MAIKGNFDEHGWLTLGFAGHQPQIAERYISTGSLYLCSTVFTALGLPATMRNGQEKKYGQVIPM